MTPHPQPKPGAQSVLTGTLWPLGTSGTLSAGTLATQAGRLQLAGGEAA